MAAHNEQLSALMDGEASDKDVRPLLATLGQDAAMRRCWHRYHLIGDAMRNNLPDHVSCSLAARVSKALETEPAITPSSNVLPFPDSKRSLPRVAGFAIAASAAALGVIAFGLLEPPLGGESGTIPAAVHAGAPASAPVQQAVATVETPDQSSALASKIHPYVVSHEYSASSAARRGLPPYARLVSFETEQ